MRRVRRIRRLAGGAGPLLAGRTACRVILLADDVPRLQRGVRLDCVEARLPLGEAAGPPVTGVDLEPRLDELGQHEAELEHGGVEPVNHHHRRRVQRVRRLGTPVARVEAHPGDGELERRLPHRLHADHALGLGQRTRLVRLPRRQVEQGALRGVLVVLVEVRLAPRRRRHLVDAPREEVVFAGRLALLRRLAHGRVQEVRERAEHVRERKPAEDLCTDERRIADRCLAGGGGNERDGTKGRHTGGEERNDLDVLLLPLRLRLRHAQRRNARSSTI